MRCTAYCTAQKYNLPNIHQAMKRNDIEMSLQRNVLELYYIDQRAEVFIFDHGCFVAWNFTKSQEQILVKFLMDFAINPLEKIEIDRFSYRINDKTKIASHPRHNIDIISLEEDQSQIKLAISYGLAQSVKLESYEEAIRKIIDKNQSITENLATKGKIKLTGRAISKRMGEIFLERSIVNLSSEYLDMPEFFWEHPSTENYYLMVEKFLDINQRVAALNRKLDVLHELFDMLTTQLQHRHSSLLEMIIIILIGTEIIISLFHITI